MFNKSFVNTLFGGLLCLLLCGCAKGIEEFEIDYFLEKTLEKYCIDSPKITGIPEREGHYFCAFESFGAQVYWNKTVLYTWVHSQEYYLDIYEKLIIRGGSNSVPIAFTLKRKKGGYVILESQVPIRGENYMADIRKIFPYHLQTRIRRKNVAQHNMLSKGLDDYALDKAMAFYFEEE